MPIDAALLMGANYEALAEAPLSPSEMVLLNAERFVGRVGVVPPFDIPPGDVPVALFRPGVRVAAQELAQTMLTVAFLGADFIGTIRVDTALKRTFPTLRLQPHLVAQKGSVAFGWPDNSVEARIATAMDHEIGRRGAADVVGIIRTLVPEDDDLSPAWYLAETVKLGLASRGLLERIAPRHTAIFTRESWRLPEPARRLGERQPIGVLRQLIDDCRIKRPHVWRLLQAEIACTLGIRKGAPQRLRRTRRFAITSAEVP
jgi:hypothetical protein